MYQKPQGEIACSYLKDKAEYLVNKKSGCEPTIYLDICFKLQFFPAQFTFCKKLVKKAYLELTRSNNGSFEIYRLLCDGGIRFFLKDPNDCDAKIALFAFKKMQETKERKKHMKTVIMYWHKLRQFGLKPSLSIKRQS